MELSMRIRKINFNYRNLKNNLYISHNKAFYVGNFLA